MTRIFQWGQVSMIIIDAYLQENIIIKIYCRNINIYKLSIYFIHYIENIIRILIYESIYKHWNSENKKRLGIKTKEKNRYTNHYYELKIIN